jgi:predicted GIY-YIG superfamily endonuclease
VSDSGIYVIANTINGKVYVGSAVHLAARIRDHSMRLSRGIHPNGKLQRAWSKYGGAQKKARSEWMKRIWAERKAKASSQAFTR